MWKWFKWILIGLIILAILVVGFIGGNNLWKKWQFSKSKNDKFITASPIDLTEIGNISPFRSCMGHDHSGLNIDGVEEKTRSMKHYVQPLSQFDGTSDKVELYAPFDGKIARIEKGKESFKDQDPRFGGYGVNLYPSSSPAWTMEFGHIYNLPELDVGSKVKSGQLIGYAYVQKDGSSFDLALYSDSEFSRGFNGEARDQTLDSILNHMTDPVLAEFTKYAAKDKFIITKEYRDTHPCVEVDRGVNVTGMNESGFDTTPEEQALIVEINYDPKRPRKGEISCSKDSDCPDKFKCLLKDGDPNKGICELKQE